MNARAFPHALKAWRQSRRHSQLDLALAASVSQRHLSFLESGKAAPSRQMVLQLADALELPLRECNDLLQAAGFAPAYAEPALDDAQLAPVREALTCMLEHHAPFPALVVDRDWQLLQINAGVQRLLGACELTPERLARLGDAQGRLNTLRLTLHPDGLSPFIENRDQVLAHLVSRSRRDQALSLRGHSWQAIADLVPAGLATQHALPHALLPVLPLVLRIGDTRLSLFTTLTTFGTPLDVTTDELRVESFYPMDEETRAWFRGAQA